jgi:NADH-quinone oxidoreductase subunit J
MQVLFWVISIICLLSALMVVTRRNLVHAALYLVLTLFSVAVLFVLLEAGFLAVVQVLVYIGAIAILMIFSIMFTRKVTDLDEDAFNQNAGWAAVIALIVGAGLLVTLGSWPGVWAFTSELQTTGTAAMVQLGEAFWLEETYLIPTLVASVLLLAALIGSIKVAWPKGNEEA